MTSFENQPVALFGLGRSGIAAALALQAGGADVAAWDDAEDVRARAGKHGIRLRDLYTLYADDWRRQAALVLAPGVPLDYPRPHAIVSLARRAGCEVIGDVELLGRAKPEAAYIGITGTNGKSTTTALVGHILKAAGIAAEVGGNIGTPVLDLQPLDANGIYVLEMSSYQLDLTRSVTFDVAVLLNISADHLDRHGGMQGYIAAKKKIFRLHGKPTASLTAVVGVDNQKSRAVYEDLKADGRRRVIAVSGHGRDEGPVAGGVYAAAGMLIDDRDGRAVPVMDLGGIEALSGAHNHQNAAAAFTVVRAAGLGEAAAADAIRGFPGLAHRQEVVAANDGVLYVNDSKATNSAAAARALAAHAAHGDIYWIAGGRLKEGGLAALTPYLANVRHAFLIGEAADAIAAFLGDRVPFDVSGDLATAFAQARDMARDMNKGAERPVVLLSPACASFDQFKDFEARGDAFRDLVESSGGRGEGSGQ